MKNPHKYQRKNWNEFQIEMILRDKKLKLPDGKEVLYPDIYKHDPKLALALAKHDYFNYTSIAALVVRYGIPHPTLEYHVSKKKLKPWRKLREKHEDEEFYKIVNSSRTELKQVVTLSIRAILKALHRYNKEDYTMSMEEIKKVSDVLGNAFKIHQLQQDQPTDIVLEKTDKKAIQEILNELKADEFMDYDIRDIVEGKDSDDIIEN